MKESEFLPQSAHIRDAAEQLYADAQHVEDKRALEADLLSLGCLIFGTLSHLNGDIDVTMTIHDGTFTARTGKPPEPPPTEWQPRGW